MPEALWIEAGEVIDSLGRRNADVLISGGLIEAVVEPGSHGDAGSSGAQHLDASGCLVSPGLVDMHTHLREPGGERAETIESGCRAAAAGGYTAICAMANTSPVADTASVIRFVREEAERVGICEVLPVGAITVRLAGEHLSPLGELAAEGVRLFSDDGRCLQSAELMRRALEYVGQLDGIVANHAEDCALVCSGGGGGGEPEGVMNEGGESARLGLPGRPWVAETVIVVRDLLLAEMTGARLHVPHVSTAASVDAIGAAKERGVSVTAEVTPHHLLLTESACESYDPAYRVNPPLRTAADVEALRTGLRTGVIDVVATDHAPHPEEEKERAFDDAPPGMTGLETALGVLLTDLVEPSHIEIETLLAAMSWKPSRLLGLKNHGGPIQPGAHANLAVIDPAAEWVVDPVAMETAGGNTAFASRRLRGRVRHTIFEGTPVVVDSRVAGKYR